jgi:hypothetical protein
MMPYNERKPKPPSLREAPVQVAALSKKEQNSGDNDGSCNEQLSSRLRFFSETVNGSYQTFYAGALPRPAPAR